MSRREQIPPYEILRYNGVGGEPKRVNRSSSALGPQARTRWRIAGPWLPHWLGGGPEVELRLPRTLALSIGGGLIGLIVLAFVLGYAQGQSVAAHPGEQPANAGVDVSDQAFSPPPPRGTGNAPASDKNAKGETNSASKDAHGSDNSSGSSEDPRQPGLNYFVLATPHRQDARPLVEFLERRGVQTTLVPVDHDSVQIVAVNEGFAAEELGSDRREKYEDWLRRLGRSWSRHRNSPRYNLSSMYPVKYQGD